MIRILADWKIARPRKACHKGAPLRIDGDALALIVAAASQDEVIAGPAVEFGVGVNPRYPDAEEVPYTVLINPLLEPIGTDLEDGWEGCLSVPGMRGVVPRHANLRYRGYDQSGNPIDRTVGGFHARVVQHETDHLLGILYPMRMRDLRNFGFNEELFPGQQIIDE